jgi:hypothetical protein
MRGLALVLLCALSGCSHTVQVRYEVPLNSPETRGCVKGCLEHHTARGARYAECLQSCPRAREVEGGRCRAAARRRVACAERRYEEPGPAPMAAIVGSVVATTIVTVLVVLLQ